MKAFLPLILIVIIFSNCTSYKSGQTPDDVYFSPERPVEEYVRVEKKNDRQYRSEEEIYDDRYVRMRLRNRMWTVLDDEYYSYNPYHRRYSNNYIYYNNDWNRYNTWNCYYNPYATGIFISSNPSTAIYNRPRNYNLFVFDGGNNTNNNNTSVPKGYRGSNPGYRDNTDNYRGSGTNAGNFLRDAFGTSSNTKGSSSSGSSSSSSSNSNSSSSGSSSSSSSGNAPVRKF